MRQVFLKVNSLVTPKHREREIKEHEVHELAKSIHTLGLLSPIIVSQDKKTVIAGAHRVEAHKLLGIEEIEARIIINEQDAKLIEIDENYKRNDLSLAERKQHALSRVNEIMLRMRESEYKKAIQESVDNKNLSAKDAPEVLSIAMGLIPLESASKPKIKEVAQKALNRIKKLAIEVAEGEFNLSRRYLRDALKAQEKTKTVITPRIYFDDIRPEDVTSVVASLNKKALKTIKKLGEELTLELNEIKGNYDENKEVQKLKRLIIKIQKIGD
ncbi:TPA: ParB N-terminal domain-containing protein [Vibrio vulnificus]|uniref:ParB N-terminal domain-containing protein n=1 Tax=Vibrio parahaemolyticus TaxID=670 RepID=UPI002361FBB8|nr:ParB N-terminal domain-containing protein [Vibrio parahaemolyticus]HDY7968043.1 ParB N-terminal domain-containing protein [Vibrio vulnificus]